MILWIRSQPGCNICEWSLSTEQAKELRGWPARNLEVLYLSEAEVTKEKFAAFGSMPRLKFLDLESNQWLGDEIIELVVKQAPDLEAINLGRSNVSGGNLHLLSKLKKLKEINLNETPINDAGLLKLGKAVPQIRVIELNGCPNLTENCLSAFKGCTSLETLALNRTDVSEKVLLSMPIGDLRNLWLDQTHVNLHKFLQQSGPLPKLDLLDLEGVSSVKDADLQQLVKQAPNLVYLDLSETTVSDHGIAELIKLTKL